MDLGSRERPWVNEVSALLKGTWRASPTCMSCEGTWSSAVTRRGVCRQQDLGIPASRAVGNECAWFASHPVCGIFVTAARTD